MIDKNLFPYNLAVMAMMKNEEPYLKEWLDYHLLAGVNHFYIYDNESNDTTKKVLQPYIDADIVTYTPFPGKDNQLLAYNDALQRFKFESRYMAFIDVDEFMFPKAHLSLTKFINDIAKKNPSAGGFEIRFMSSSSNSNAGINYSDILGMINGYATAPKKNIKSIINPRMANYFQSLQSPIYYDGIEEISDNDVKLATAFPNPGHNNLNIKTDLQNAEIMVYDIMGKMIFNHEIVSDITTINSENWPSGMYIWKVIANGKEAESGKWIKQ